MTLENLLRQKLNESPTRPGRHDLNLTDEASGWSLYLTTEHQDKWTSVVWELSLRRPDAPGDLAAWAERIVQKTRGGLLESLKVVEIDPTRNQGLIRSAVPTEQDGKPYYYELLLAGTFSVQVRRFQGANGNGKREQVPFVLTNEALIKLVADITAEK